MVRKKWLIVKYYSSKERFWCTECNAKNSALWKLTFMEKKKRLKLSIWTKWSCLRFFSRFFSETVFCKELRVFLRYIQYTKTFLLTYPNQQFKNISYFHFKGGLLWFRTSHKLIAPLKRSKNWKQKNFKQNN